MSLDVNVSQNKWGEKDARHDEFEDTNGVIRIRKLRKDRQGNGQNKKDKQRSTNKYTESKD
jgi:hypothetical protein